MILKSIKLQNFLSHKDTFIDFSKYDVVCFYGDNGSGKSSVIDGILYALYGFTPKGKDDVLIMNGTKNMNVVLEFEIDKSLYKISKQKTRGQSKVVQLFKDGNLILTGDTVSDFVENLLGMNYNTFISTYFLTQDNAYKFISATASDRFRILFDMLSLDNYQEYKKQASILRRTLDNQIKLLTDQISNKEKNLIAKETFLEERKVLQSDLDMLSDQLAILENSKLEKEKLLVVNKEKVKEAENIQSEIQRLDKEIKILTAKQIELDGILKMKSEIENAVKEREKFSNELTEISSVEKNFFDKNEQLKKNYNQLLLQERNLSVQREQVKGKKEKIKIEINNNLKSLREYEQMALLIQKTPCEGKGEFSKCELLSSAIRAKDFIPSIQEKISSLQQELQQMDEQESFILGSIQNLIERKSKIENELEKTLSHIEIIQNRKRICIQKISDYDSLSRMHSQLVTAETEKNNCIMRIDELEKQKEQLLQKEQQYASLWDTINTLQIEMQQIAQKIATMKQKKSEIENKLNYINSQIMKLEEDEKEVLKMKQQLDANVSDLNHYMLLEEIYDKIPKIIFQNYIEQIESIANNILEKISPSNMTVKLVTEKTTKTTKQLRDTLEISVSDLLTDERNVETFSGGEKTRLALAFTVALSEIASFNKSRLKTLAIDEPPGLDNQGFKDFADCIKQLVNLGVFDKCIVVSHSGELIDEFDYKLKFEKSTGYTKVYGNTNEPIIKGPTVFKKIQKSDSDKKLSLFN